MNLRKTLIVDDELEILKAFHFLLLKYEDSIVFAESGNEAVTKLRENDIGLVISDFKMPDGNGEMLLQHVLSHHLNLEFYFFTSSNVEKFLKGHMVNGVFSKPSDFMNVLNKIKQYLKGHPEVAL